MSITPSAASGRTACGCHQSEEEQQIQRNRRLDAAVSRRAERVPGQAVLHRNRGFAGNCFLQARLAQALDIVIGVRCTRRLNGGRQARPRPDCPKRAKPDHVRVLDVVVLEQRAGATFRDKQP